MLAEKLKALFKQTPGVILDGPALDDLVSDTEAAVIKVLHDSGLLKPVCPHCGDPFLYKCRNCQQAYSRPPVSTLAGEDLYVSMFGVHLHNLITFEHPRGPAIGFDDRKRITRAVTELIAAMTAGL